MKNKELSRVIVKKELTRGDSYYFTDEYLIHLFIRIPYKTCFGRKSSYYRKVYTINEEDLCRLSVYSKSQIEKVLIDLYLKKRRNERLLRVIRNLPD